MCGSGPTLAGVLGAGMESIDGEAEAALRELSGRSVIYTTTPA